MSQSLVVLLVFCGLNAFAQLDEVREPQAVPDVPPASAEVSNTSDTTLVKAKTPAAEATVKKEISKESVKAEAPAKPVVAEPAKPIVETKPAPLAEPVKPVPAVETKPAPVVEPASRSRLGFHVAAGFPHPATAGLDYLSASKKLGFSLIGGQFQEKPKSDVELSISSIELQFQYHPWATPFYVGLGAGNHVLKADKTVDVSGTTAKASVEVNASYLTPQIGWIKTWDSGFTLGFKAGWLIPSGSTSDVSSDAPASVQATAEYQSAAKDIKDQADKYGSSSLPYVTLLQLGWLF